MLGRAIFLVAVLLPCVPSLARANGGAFETSAIERSGNLVPMQKRLITLETETLNVYLDGDRAGVYVTYLLMNNGPDDSVTFGFPIDVATEQTLNTPNGYDYVLSNSIEKFEVEDGGKPVPVEKTIDEPLPDAQRPRGVGSEVKLIRRWSLMTLKFQRGKHKSLSVNYRVTCAARDEGFEGDTLWKYGPRHFAYTFHPAATWGDGRVGSLSVALDTKWLRENDLASVSGLIPPGSSDDAGVKHWEFNEQDLAKLPDLSFSYDPTALYQDRDVKKQLLDPAYLKTFTVSSSLPPSSGYQYGKEAMRDGDLRTAWVEGAKGPGLGETITLDFKGSYLTELAFLNGYLADESLYHANARIKKLWVELELGEGAEPNEKTKQFEVTLPDRSYKNFNPRFPFAAADWIVQQPQGNAFIDRVKLTILEVYPSQKCQDTAITEIYLCGFRK